MKTGFIALILTLVMASSAVAGDWNFHIGAPPPPAPVYPGPYGYSYFYLTPPTRYFGFSYHKGDRRHGRRDEHCRPPQRHRHDHHGRGHR